MTVKQQTHFIGEQTMSNLTSKQENVLGFLSNTRTELDAKTVGEHLSITSASARSLLNALVKKGLVIKNETLYSTNPQTDDTVKTEKQEVKTMAKQTKAQKAAAAAAAEAENQSEAVTLEEALAEDGKTTNDIGKKEKAEKAPKEPKAKRSDSFVFNAEGKRVKNQYEVDNAARKVWDLLDALVPQGLSRSEMLKVLETENGMKLSLTSTPYAQWKTYHEHFGTWPKVEEFRTSRKAEAEASKAAEKEAAAKVKADEKAAKAEAKAKAKAEKAEAAAKAKQEKADAKAAKAAEKEAAEK